MKKFTGLIILLFILILSLSFKLYFYRISGFDNKESLKEYLEQVRKENDLPALAAAVVRMDKIEDSAVCGVRKMKGQDRVTINDKFHIGSCAKSVTGIIAGKLVEEGKLSWDTKIINIYPELKQWINPVFNEVTFYDILTHRSGIPQYLYMGDFNKIRKFDGSPMEQRRKFAIWQFQQKEKKNPGEFAYSNAGYGIAASICEQITGETFEEYVKKVLFDPLELKRSDFGRPAKNDRKQPWGHWQRWRNRTPVETVPPDKYTLSRLSAPGDGISMSINDFARYLQFHLKGLNGKNTFLKPETVKFLHKPAGDYAIGWNSRYFAGQKCSIHFGSDGTFCSMMAVCHDNNLAAVVCTNSGLENAGITIRNVLNKLIREYSD